MAAVESAAIAHQLMPCEPVWLATMTGSVLALVPVSSAAKKYSFQQRISERMKAATMPGSAIGRMMRKNAPHDREAVDQRRFVELDGDRVELVAHDPDDDRQHRQRVEQDQPDLGVEQRQLLVEDEERQREHDRRQDELATGRRTRCPRSSSRGTCTRSG